MARWQSSNTTRLILDKSKIFFFKMYRNTWQVMTSTCMKQNADRGDKCKWESKCIWWYDNYFMSTMKNKDTHLIVNNLLTPVLVSPFCCFPQICVFSHLQVRVGPNSSCLLHCSWSWTITEIKENTLSFITLINFSMTGALSSGIESKQKKLFVIKLLFSCVCLLFHTKQYSKKEKNK